MWSRNSCKTEHIRVVAKDMREHIPSIEATVIVLAFYGIRYMMLPTPCYVFIDQRTSFKEGVLTL